jgi:hypothetical protein
VKYLILDGAIHVNSGNGRELISTASIIQIRQSLNMITLGLHLFGNKYLEFETEKEAFDFYKEIANVLTCIELDEED